MAGRLKPWLHCIISEFQSAFIPNRLMSDNVLVTHELLPSLRTHPFIALTLDIVKAFDRVEWPFSARSIKKVRFL